MAEAQLRAVSNLHIPEPFRLSKSERNSGFLLLYSNKFTEGAEELILKLIFQPFLPQARVPSFATQKKHIDAAFKGQGSPVCSSPRMSVLKKTTNKDKQEGFFFEAPLFTNNISEPSVQAEWIRKLTDYKEVPDIEEEKVEAGWYLGKNVLQHLKFSSNTMQALHKCLLGMTINEHGEIWAKFFITKREAEFLTSTAFQAIRPANLYVPLQMWVGSAFGTKVDLPVSSLSITHIKQEVNKVMKKGAVVPRNKLDGICVLEDGNLVWIPQADDAVAYENALHEYGIQDDGSYTFDPTGKMAQTEFRIGQQETGKKLPANMPVYTDWVNLKFAYSLTTGILDVLDLERAVGLKAYHVRDYLDTPYGFDDGKPFKFLTDALTLAEDIEADVAIAPTQGEMEWGKLREDITSMGVSYYIDSAIRNVVSEHLVEEIKGFDDIRIRHFSPNSPIVSLRAVGRSLVKAMKACEENIDNVYKRYSVWTTIQFMARLKIFSKYVTDFDKIVDKDNKDRDAYLKQGIDPKHKVDPVPNIGKTFSENGYMPHQAKAENMMREGPQFGVYSVSAGGGKTILILTNILQEIKRGNCKRPLVLCPAHLVADYIKEAVYVTEGKVNVIAITTQTMRYHGMERLTKMIQIAPINTIFVTDYNFIKGKGEDIGYGIKTVTIYRNVEFLRLFGFDLISIDESHFLKNVSLRSESAHRFISEIPMKRLASGTFVHDTITDIVSQFALLDPTVFGDREKFMKDYALEVRGGKVMAWKPNAQREIHRKMREHCVFIDCKRKEWATLLPNPEERFHGVELTERQAVVYKSVLDYTMELINKAIENDPKLRKALSDAEDENKFESLASLLKPYLSRLEQYLAAPSRDPLGKEVLIEKEDKLSPKVKAIIKIIRHHFGQEINEGWDEDIGAKRKKGQELYGKVLIFTNHIEVAEEIYETLPPDLKKMCILYKAGEKMEARAEFENNPNKKIMVGVEKSMNTGLNFQFVSRLIRVETVWTPGEMEQGNSRINRPQLKKKDLRKNIFFDWIIVNKSFDITKASRLIAKTLQNAKFDEPENPKYQGMEDLDLIPMTLDTIQQMNDWTSDLQSYLEAYQTYKVIQANDYEDYRKKNKDKMDSVEVPNAGVLKGSKLMSRVPYVPGMELYGTDQLGLVRYDEFMRKDIEYEIEDEDEGEEDEGDDTSTLRQATRAKSAEELKKVMGIAVHTEWGDGEVEGVASKILKVRLSNGEKVRSRKLATFVITRKSTNSKDIRNQLLKMAGKLPIDTPVDVPADKAIMKGGKIRPVKEEDIEDIEEKEKEAEPTTPVILKKDTDAGIELNFEIVNDFLGISCPNMDNAHAINVLSNLGFRPSPEYYFAKLKTPQNLVDLVTMWKKKGFVYPGYLNSRIKQLYTQLKSKAGPKTFGVANKMGLKNFYVREFKPGSNSKEIKPYPLILGDGIYMALPAQAQVGTRNAIKMTVPGIVWKHAKKSELIYFVLNKNEAKNMLKKVIDSGLDITNKKQLKVQFDKLKVVKRSASKDDE